MVQFVQEDHVLRQKGILQSSLSYKKLKERHNRTVSILKEWNSDLLHEPMIGFSWPPESTFLGKGTGVVSYDTHPWPDVNENIVFGLPPLPEQQPDIEDKILHNTQCNYYSPFVIRFKHEKFKHDNRLCASAAFNSCLMNTRNMCEGSKKKEKTKNR